MVNSKQKGARGEREFAQALRDELGVEARRGQQYSGSPDSPDVVTSIPNVHFEVKRTKRGYNVQKAMDQAKADCGSDTPIVALRQDRGEWILGVTLRDLKTFCEVICGGV